MTLSKSDAIKVARIIDRNFDGSITKQELREAKGRVEEQLKGLEKNKYASLFDKQVAKKYLDDIAALNINLQGGIWKYFRGVSFKNDGTIDISREDFVAMDASKREAILSADGGEYQESDGITTLAELLSQANFPDLDVVNSLNQKNFRISRPNQTCYQEIDIPTDEGFFGNPDFAFNDRYEILVNYRALYSSGDYPQLLVKAGIREEKNPNGIYKFFDGDKNISAFEAYSRIKIEAFISDQFGKDPDNQQEAQKLRDTFLTKGIIPIVVRSLLRGPGPVMLKLYDRKTCKTWEVRVINSSNSRSFPTEPGDFEKAL